MSKNLHDPFCTYITFYRGNKLPPFYIGYTSTQKIMKGYHGTVTSKLYKDIWKSELKNNNNLFKTVILTTHQTRNEALEKEEYFQSFQNVHKNPLFINLHISNKKWFSNGRGKLPLEEVETIKKRMSGSGNPMYGVCGSKHPMYGSAGGFAGKKHTPQTKKTLSETRVGNKNPFYQKTHTLQTKMKWSEKRGGENNPSFGKIWITNGIEQKYINNDEEVPDGWIRGTLPRSDEFRKRQAAYRTGTKWMYHPELGVTKSVKLSDTQIMLSKGWLFGCVKRRG